MEKSSMNTHSLTHTHAHTHTQGPADVQTSKDGLRAYVADGGNHKIRSIDLLTGEVTTLCGAYNGTAGECVREREKRKEKEQASEHARERERARE